MMSSAVHELFKVLGLDIGNAVIVADPARLPLECYREHHRSLQEIEKCAADPQAAKSPRSRWGMQSSIEPPSPQYVASLPGTVVSEESSFGPPTRQPDIQPQRPNRRASNEQQLNVQYLRNPDNAMVNPYRPDALYHQNNDTGLHTNAAPRQPARRASNENARCVGVVLLPQSSFRRDSKEHMDGIHCTRAMSA
jgi:hypothetical protein